MHHSHYRFDSGVFAVKFMEYWNGSTIKQAVVEVSLIILINYFLEICISK